MARRKMFPEEFELYSVLQVPKNASPEQIKKAFRRISSLVHPDKHGGNKFAEEYFKNVLQAYEVLSDPESKKIYDKIIKNCSSEDAERYQKNKVVFPHSLWSNLDRIRENGCLEETVMWLYGLERDSNFELFLGVHVGGESDACEYSRRRMVSENPGLVYIPCQTKSDSNFRRVDLKAMIEQYNEDPYRKSLNKVFIFPREIRLYRIYPDSNSEDGWMPKIATIERPGTILSIIFSKEINEWRDRMVNKFTKLHNQYLKEYYRLKQK